MRSAIAILSLAILAGASMPWSSGASNQEVAADPISYHVPPGRARTLRTTVTGGTPPERVIVLEAIARFSALPGEMPPLQVRIFGKSGCGGLSGVFRGGTDIWQVDICDVTRWVILHEMGHAWTALHLTQQQRSRFVERWGLETWNSRETPWRLRGAEHAADTIAWGLVDESIGCHSSDGPIARRLLAFRQLTGVDSQRDHCAKPGF